MPIDTTVVTLIEAVVLLLTNIAGGALTALAWGVSNVDVRESRAWVPPTADPVEQARLRHNRRIVTEDARYGETRRFFGHAVLGLVGVFWILTPQPLNPSVVWWAVAVRAAVVLLSLVLIDKTLHHLIARWRFDRPHSTASILRAARPSLRLAWQDVRSQEGRP